MATLLNIPATTVLRVFVRHTELHIHSPPCGRECRQYTHTENEKF